MATGAGVAAPQGAAARWIICSALVAISRRVPQKTEAALCAEAVTSTASMPESLHAQHRWLCSCCVHSLLKACFIIISQLPVGPSPWPPATAPQGCPCRRCRCRRHRRAATHTPAGTSAVRWGCHCAAAAIAASPSCCRPPPSPGAAPSALLAPRTAAQIQRAPDAGPPECLRGFPKAGTVSPER